MFLCECCGDAIGPNIPRKIHPVLRANGQIEREIPVCAECSTNLQLVPLPDARKFAEQKKLVAKVNAEAKQKGMEPKFTEPKLKVSAGTIVPKPTVNLFNQRLKQIKASKNAKAKKQS